MVKVNQKTCIGCGLCSAICDEIFEMVETDDGMKAKVKAQKDIPCVKEAIDQCPTDAISK